MDRLQRQDLEYLVVDKFMRDAVSARALASAFELGIVDSLASRDHCAAVELGAKARIDRSGIELLLGLLRGAGVVETVQEGFRLTQGFRDALRFRDLMEAKLDFAATVAPDFQDLFSVLLADPAGFFERARLFELFSYDRCFESTPENVSNTARWMRFTTMLTRYEAAGCIAAFDFSKHRRMLDVGGNSGEFALRICKAHPGLRATVLDLPVVCDIGERHVAREPEAVRIAFARVDRNRSDFPAGFDLAAFKSMLHDWPDDRMEGFLAKAYEALDPGGSLLIFERGPLRLGEQGLAWSQVPLALFFRSYREPGEYVGALERAGFGAVQSRSVELDMPFMLISAEKPAR